MTKIACSSCGKATPGYDTVRFKDSEHYRDLCNYCYNATMAEISGLIYFENARFDPITLVDKAGVSHTFHFRYRLFVTGVSLDAFELVNDTPAGLQFRVIGEPDMDPFELLGQITLKIKGALAIRHLEEGPYGLCVADHGIVRGQIECDLEDPYRERPLLIIDGKEITWDQFGKILILHEGWRFKLKILGKDEED